MNIVVHEDNTGYAPKYCRFHAIDDDTYDWAPDQRKASSIGYGATREEAVADLLEIMEAEGEITLEPSGWVTPPNSSIAAEYRLTRRSADAATGYDLGLPELEVSYRWNGRDAWISGYRDGLQRREPMLVCLHSNNGWRLRGTDR